MSAPPNIQAPAGQQALQQSPAGQALQVPTGPPPGPGQPTQMAQGQTPVDPVMQQVEQMMQLLAQAPDEEIVQLSQALLGQPMDKQSFLQLLPQLIQQDPQGFIQKITQLVQGQGQVPPVGPGIPPTPGGPAPGPIGPPPVPPGPPGAAAGAQGPLGPPRGPF